MNLGKGRRLAAPGLALFLILCRPLSQAKTPEVIKDSRAASLDAPMEDFNASGYALENLCRALRKPCGQENLPGEKLDDYKHAGLHLSKTSPREVLDEILKAHPGHQWAVRDDVLILEPAKRIGQDLLGRKFGSVSIHGASSFKAAVEVLKHAKIKVTWTLRPARYARIDLELTDATVREALNAIAKVDGRIIWYFAPNDPELGTANFSMGSWRESGGVEPFLGKGPLQ